MLALTQSRMIAAALERLRPVSVEIEIIRTTGDVRIDQPLAEIGGKGLFTAELDRALLDGSIDFAVHSLKDLPTELDSRLIIAAIPEREDPRDVLVGPEGRVTTLAALPPGATAGTSSLRRTALARAFRKDLRVENVRGNLDTRIRKVDEGRYDALILAAAGIRRLGLSARIGEFLDGTSWLPAPGQGALAVVTRSEDGPMREILRPLHHRAADVAVRAERALLSHLEGGCQLPVGALGQSYDGGIRLWGMVASPDGRKAVRVDRTGSLDAPEALGIEVAEILLERGAGSILDRVRADLRDEHRPPIAPP
jgi:hydroxymethylbilane synthase